MPSADCSSGGAAAIGSGLERLEGLLAQSSVCLPRVQSSQHYASYLHGMRSLQAIFGNCGMLAHLRPASVLRDHCIMPLEALVEISGMLRGKAVHAGSVCTRWSLVRWDETSMLLSRQSPFRARYGLR